MKKKSFFYIFQLIFFIVAYLCINNNIFGFLDLLSRNEFIDRRNTVLQPEIYDKKSKITLIGIDEKFFSNENISTQGLHRGYYAKVLDNINKNKPAAVGIDVFFENRFQFKQEDEKTKLLNTIFSFYDKELGDSLQSNNVIATVYDQNSHKLLIPDEMFTKNNSPIGHVNSFIDRSKINIGIPAVYTGETNIYPLSLQVYLQYQANQIKKYIKNTGISIEPLIRFTDEFLNVKIYKQEISIPLLTEGGKKYIFTPLYVTSPKDIKYLSFSDVYNGLFDENDIKDRIIYIGATDTTLNDIKSTLKGTIPGVMMHINETISYLNNDFIYVLNKNQVNNLLFVLILLNMIISLIINRDKASLTIVFILFSEILLLLVIGFLIATLKLPYSIFIPLGTIIVLISLHLIFNGFYIFIETIFLKEDIQKLFSLYVGEKISDIKQNETNEHKIAEEKNVAIFFSDIAGFTNISEKLTPIQSIQFINKYLDTMSQDISVNKGFIDKYIGDAIMAFWEENNGPYFAAKSAISNILSIPQINSQLKHDIENFQGIDIRIGLNYGKAIVGDIGSEKYKLNYTIIGDHVNLASRLEGINKHYGTKIIMSEYFFNEIKENNEFLWRKIDKILVKGKEIAVEIYELFPIYKSLLSTEAISKYSLFIEQYHKGLEEYYKGDFNKAIECFQQAMFFQTDKASQLFIKRCEYLIDNPPIVWNGIWKYDEK